MYDEFEQSSSFHLIYMNRQTKSKRPPREFEQVVVTRTGRLLE